MKDSSHSCFSRFLILIYAVLFLVSCSPVKQTLPPGKTPFPSDAAIAPSSFRCEGIFIAADSKKNLLLISKMLGQGSSLFYAVSAGDTIDAKFISRNEKPPAINSPVEAVLEERLKLNSDKPDFIIRQIKMISQK